MATNPQPLALGTYDVEVECPDCGIPAVLTIELLAVKTIVTDEPAQLGVKLVSKKAEHKCGQERML
jgi:hypothetical protein